MLYKTNNECFSFGKRWFNSSRSKEQFIFYLMKYLYHRTHKHSLFVYYFNKYTCIKHIFRNYSDIYAYYLNLKKTVIKYKSMHSDYRLTCHDSIRRHNL